MKIETQKITNHKNYYVTKCGKVINIKTKKTLKGCDQSCGYVQVNLNGKMHYIHRLVATAFVPNQHNKPEVNHIDGDKKNNHYKNLEWVTSSENSVHAFKTGLSNVRGENHHQSKLKNKDVIKIRELLKRGCLQKEIAKLYGVGVWCISDIKNKKTWSHLH